jgi:hypothetical protein
LRFSAEWPDHSYAEAVDQEVAKTLGELELKLQELERELTTIGRRDASPEPPLPPGRLIDEAVESTSDRAVRIAGDRDGPLNAEPSAEEQAAAEGDGFGGPPVFGGEEIPAQAGATIERDWTVEARETAYGEIPTPPSPPTPTSPIPGPPIPPPAPTPQPPPTTPPGPPVPTAPPGPPLPGAPGMGRGETQGVHRAPSQPSQYPPPGLYQSAYPPDPRQTAAVEESLSVDLAALVRFRDKLASTMDGLIDEYSQMLSAEPPPRSRSNT